MNANEIDMMILLQQVTEGQLIKKVQAAAVCNKRTRRPALLRTPLGKCGMYYGYFAGFSLAGTSTLSTCSRICVPDSSFTFSVFDTITGPGVLGLASELRLRPFSPTTPCGMPTLSGFPPDPVSSSAADVPLAACVVGDSLTVSGMEEAVDMLADAPALG